jgi:hypothetical protein
MLNSDKNIDEFKMFFQRTDVELCMNFLFRITDVKQNLSMLNSPSYVFLYDNWVKYRGY